MEIDWMMLAQKVTENPDGTRTFHGVFDNIITKGPPYTYGPIAIVIKPTFDLDEVGVVKTFGIRWSRFMEGVGFEPYTDTIEQDNRLPDLTKVIRASELILINQEYQWFPEPGEYAFEVLVEDVLKGRKKLKVHALD